MSDAIRISVIFSMAVLLTASSLRAGSQKPYKTDNGLTVILRPVSAAKEVAVVVLFDLGGDHDPVGRSGRAHLLEHLYCTAAAGDTPARGFAQIQKRYGRGYNQQTGFDYTVLAGVVKADKLGEELADVAARMSALRITDADLQRETPRVLAELRNMYGAMPSLAGMNHVRMRLHPIAQGGRHGGKAEHVRAIGLDELRQFWRDHYRPPNAILVLAGKFDAAEVRKLIQERFGAIASGKSPPTPPVRPAAKTPATHRIKVKPIMRKATGVVSVGYAAPRPGSEDYAPFLLVVCRLWALSRGLMRPGQVPPMYYPMLDDPTTIALQAALPAGKDAESVLKQLDQRLQAAVTAKVTPLDKMRAVNGMAMLGTVDVPPAMWAQNPYGLAFSVGRRHQMKIDGGKLRAAIQAATDADMRRLATSVFAPNKRIAVIVEVEK